LAVTSTAVATASNHHSYTRSLTQLYSRQTAQGQSCAVGSLGSAWDFIIYYFHVRWTFNKAADLIAIAIKSPAKRRGRETAGPLTPTHPLSLTRGEIPDPTFHMQRGDGSTWTVACCDVDARRCHNTRMRAPDGRRPPLPLPMSLALVAGNRAHTKQVQRR
jgi:hypothetical protein